MIILLILIVTVIIGLISYWYYEFFKHMPYLSKFNGPYPLPIIGNLYKICDTKDIIPVVMEYIKQYGPVIRLWFGFRPRIIISDYRVAEILLESTTILDKSYDYKFFESWLGTGLLTSTGAKWKRQRKLLTPTFHFQILEQYISIFNNQSEILVTQIKNGMHSGPLDVYPLINLCSLDIVCEAVMGIQIKAQTDYESDYVHSVAEITSLIFAKMFSVFKIFDVYYKFTEEHKRFQRALRILHDHTNYVINSREKEFAASRKVVNSNDDEFGVKKRKAFLDLLLECQAAGAQITRENIREEVDTFMFEGHDTTSSAVSFTLYCLANHKDIQEKVVNEIREIMNNDIKKVPQYQELQNMKYLEQVIKETMRIYPPVGLIARELTEDTNFDGVIIPKGTNLTLFIYGLHRQEEMFPDPEKFDPERFTLENCAKRSPFAYVPFSAGVRNCIGQRFAMLAVKTMVAKILLNFEVTPLPGFKPNVVLESILRSHNGVFVNLKERN